MADILPTVVTLDQDRTLRFDYDALDRLSGLALARRGGRSPLELWQAANGMDLDAMALMLWAGARHEDKDLTIDQVRSGLRQALRMRKTTYKQLNETLNAAINQSEMIGVFQSDGDDAEGNAPRAGRGE